MTLPLRSPCVAPLCLLLLTALGACGPGGGEGPQAAEDGVQRRELPSVRATPVRVQPMARLLETTSKLESELEIDILPRVSGVVLQLGVEEGDTVEAGQVLATLEDTQQALAVRDAEVALHESQNTLEKLQLAVREAQARIDRSQLALEQARRDHERNQKLFLGEQKTSTLSQSALEASKLAMDNASADRLDADIALERSKLELAAGQTAVERSGINLERAQLDLAWTRITAPFGGVVARRDVKVGDAVGPSTVCFVLTDFKTLRAVFSRPQEEMGLFDRRGAVNGEGRLAMSATADAFPGRSFDGWIERISPTIDPQSGQFRVVGRLECVQDNGRVRLLPGMLVRLKIVTDLHPEALVVPKRALDREGERRYLLIAEPEPGQPELEHEGRPLGTISRAIVRRVEVREGFAEGDWIEVQPAEGVQLGAGQMVIVVGGRDLTEGDAVLVDEDRSGGSGEVDVPAPATVSRDG